MGKVKTKAKAKKIAKPKRKVLLKLTYSMLTGEPYDTDIFTFYTNYTFMVTKWEKSEKSSRWRIRKGKFEYSHAGMGEFQGDDAAEDIALAEMLSRAIADVEFERIVLL